MQPPTRCALRLAQREPFGDVVCRNCPALLDRVPQQLRSAIQVCWISPEFAAAWQLLDDAVMLTDPAGTNDLTREIIGAAICVHRELGPGLLESVYAACFEHELADRQVRFVAQARLPVHYRGVRLEVGYRVDLIVNDSVVVEIKAVDAIAPVHRAQLRTYLRLSQKPIGLIVNFNVPVLKNGVARLLNERLLKEPRRQP